jgi:D-alanyl-D-alanine carboxypeptidase
MSLTVLNKIKTSWLIAVVFCVGACYDCFRPGTVASPLPQASPTPAATETARPLYGLQGVLIETLDGKVVSSQAENEQFNPASTMKLATALVALRTLGPEHRFATGVWTDGVLDKTTGVINGKSLHLRTRSIVSLRTRRAARA